MHRFTTRKKIYWSRSNTFATERTLIIPPDESIRLLPLSNLLCKEYGDCKLHALKNIQFPQENISAFDNFYSAKIFMGDGGALFLGFMIAVLSVVGPLKRSTMIAVVIPVIVLGIPIFDTLFAIIRRALNGQPIMAADKGHLHHQLMASGFGQIRAVLMLYGISAIMGMAAVLTSRELYKDSIVLVCIAVIYLYVFLTDPNRRIKTLRAVNVEQDEKNKEGEENI